MVGQRAVVRADEQRSAKFARYHRQPVEQGFGDDRREEIGGRGHARHAVALGAVAGGREKRAGGLRPARLVPPSAMLHNQPMAGEVGEAEKTDAPAGAWRDGLRATPRAAGALSTPPPSPGYGGQQRD